MVIATGIGSWPDTDIREAVVTVRDQLATGLPYLPELPARGPGADMIGRAAGLLEGLSVDLQPSGWRITERPGRDAARTAAYWRQDLDELAEAYDGYTGALKLSVTGPWTLAANVRTSRGELLTGVEILRQTNHLGCVGFTETFSAIPALAATSPNRSPTASVASSRECAA